MTSLTQPTYNIFDLGYDRDLLKPDGFYDAPSRMQSNMDSMNPISLGGGEIIGNLEIIDGYLQSGNFVSGSTGWKLTPTSAEINVSTAIHSLDIPDTTGGDSFHTDSDGNSWWGCNVADFASNNDNADAYILKTGVAKLQSLTVVGGAIDGTSTIGGRAASIIASAIDASGHFADDAINTAAGTILGEFAFSGSGAIQIGEYVNGVTGDLKLSPSGILARNSAGDTTFSINGNTGVAVLNGLVVGTNVGLGTAEDSAGVTAIVGNTVTTAYVNALDVNAATVSASISITTPAITGGTIQTAAGTGQRILMSGSDNTLAFYNGSNEVVTQLGGGTNIGNAIRIILDTSTMAGMRIDSDVDATAGIQIVNGGAVTMNGLAVSMTNAGAGNDGYGMLIDHRGTSSGKGLEIIRSNGSGNSIDITHSTTGSAISISNDANSAAIDIIHSGTGNASNAIKIDSSESTAISALDISYGSAYSDQYAGKFARSGGESVLFLSHTADASGTRRAGIELDIGDTTGTGAVAAAFIFNGKEVATGAVGGNQDRVLRVYVGGTVYYIPLHTTYS